MSKPKWLHKEEYKNKHLAAICGQKTRNTVAVWATVTCPKCLKKQKTRKPKTNLSFELDGKVFIVERKEKDRTIVSQEELDGDVVLKCLMVMLEQSLKKKDMDERTEKWMNRYEK